MPLDPHGVEPVFVPLSEFKPEMEANLGPFDYWKSLSPRMDHMPFKDDCDLLELVEYLPRCLILDLLGPTNWRIAMFGTEVVAHFGVEPTGMNAFDFYSEEEQPCLARRMATLCERSAPMCTTTRLKNAADITVDTEWLFLPLASVDGCISRILTSTQTLERHVDLRAFEQEGTLKRRRLLKLAYGIH